MSDRPLRLFASTALIILVCNSTDTGAWDVDPLDITQMEGESALLEITIDQGDWVEGPPNCHPNQWGVEFVGVFEDGTAKWDEDIEKPVESETITGVCSWDDPTGDAETVIPLNIKFLDDLLIESTEQALIVFDYCVPTESVKQGSASRLEDHCTQRKVTLTVEDSDLGVDIKSFTADPESIFITETTTLSWRVANAVECEPSGGGGGWAETEIDLPEGSQEVTLNEVGIYDFVLTCTGAPPGEDDEESEPKQVTSQASVEVELMPVPDLDVVRVSASKTSLTTGENFSITATIRNEGLGPSGPTGVNYLLSADNLISNNDDLLAESVMPGLEKDELFFANANAVAPVEPGSYWVGVCVDNLPSELHYGNNCSRATQIVVSGNSCQFEELACGQEKTGTIGSGDCDSGPLGMEHFARPFQLTGHAGDTVWFDSEWSFDGYLLLESPEGLVVAENDNFTSASDSHIEYTFPETGTYTLWLTSFAPQEGGDFDLEMDCDAAGGPDLVGNIPIDGLLATKPAVQFSLTSELSNVGDSASDSSTLRWMLSSDSQIDPADTELASQTVAPLAAGSVRQESMDLLTPATPGGYWVGTCVDAVPGEAATTNNCSNAMSLNVTEPPACSSAGLSCGGTVNASLNMNDCSSGPRGAGHYAQEFELGAKAGEPLSLISDWTGVDGMLYLLDPNGKVVAQNDDSPDTEDPQSRLEYVPAMSGAYSVWATTYQRNESGSFKLSAKCGKSSAPDLVTTASLAGDATVSAGGTVGVSYTVRNAGNGPADATSVLMFLSSDPAISLTDTQVESAEIGELAPGASTTMEMEVTVPGEPGDYWIGPCAEAVEGEVLTGNNCSLPLAQMRLRQADGSRSPGVEAEGDGGLLLHVTSGAACSSQPIGCGQSLQGTLQSSDCDTGPRGTGYLADPWSFTGAAGDTITLAAAWDDFDGTLYLESPAGEILVMNDDSDGTSGSQLEIVLNQAGDYTAWPTAFDQGEGGNYQLSLGCNDTLAPDLEVDQPVLSSSTVRPGQTIELTTEVHNKGMTPAAAGEMNVILAANQDLGGGTRALGSSDFPALAAGAASEQVLLLELSVPPGTYYLGACAEAEAGELDTADNCGVSGPVTVEQTDRPITFNTGLNDAWYNPETDGQGFFINVFPDDNLVFASWFTFDTQRPPASVPFQLGDPGHRWLTAQGVHDRGVAEMTVYLTAGGVFDATEPPASTPLGYGKMTLSFSDCNNGIIDFDLSSIGETGTIPITRVVDDNVPDCEEQLGGLSADTGNGDAGGPFILNRALNDAWYDPATTGQGFFFNVFPGLESVFLSWFTYDVERPPPATPFNLGEPGHRWLTAQGPFSGDTADLTVYSTGGGVFNQGSLPPGSTVEDGTIKAVFGNCNSGMVEYDIESIDLQGQIPIERIAGDSIPDCERQSTASTAGIFPDKDLVDNRCDGSVDWHFEWPEVEHVSYYQFELYRNDSLMESPRVFATPETNSFEYSGKEGQIGQQHLENWRWRYRPVIGYGPAEGETWSGFHVFSVRPPGDPCAE